jgi:hypothetical protein
MRKMDRKFSAAVGRAKTEWLEYSATCKRLEEFAREDPAGAAYTFIETAHDEYRNWQGVLRNRFGIDWRLPGRPRVVDPERLPQTLRQHCDCSEAIKACTTWGGAWILMHAAMSQARLSDEDSAQAACRAFSRVLSIVPAFFGKDMGLQEDHEAMQRRAAEGLASWVASRVSFSIAGDLKASIAKLAYEGDVPFFHRFVEELLAAMYIEWNQEQWTERLPAFVNRVTERLKNEHGLKKKHKQLDDELLPSMEDQDLAKFERQETLRQDMNRLRGWVRSARFSEREAQVYELDMKTNEDTNLIARKLDTTSGNVRALRKRYRDKLREAYRTAEL